MLEVHSTAPLKNSFETIAIKVPASVENFIFEFLIRPFPFKSVIKDFELKPIFIQLGLITDFFSQHLSTITKCYTFIQNI